MPYEAVGATETPANGPSGTIPHPGRMRGVEAVNFGPIYWTTAEAIK
jgi:hypothetical protein